MHAAVVRDVIERQGNLIRVAAAGAPITLGSGLPDCCALRCRVQWCQSCWSR